MVVRVLCFLVMCQGTLFAWAYLLFALFGCGLGTGFVQGSGVGPVTFVDMTWFLGL